ncbi:hypothetical protein BJX99DRAFT_263679 [Aspergillus californicus]
MAAASKPAAHDVQGIRAQLGAMSAPLLAAPTLPDIEITAYQTPSYDGHQVSIYRIAPKRLHPRLRRLMAQNHATNPGAEDMYTASRWLIEHAAAVGVDTSRTATKGESAGRTFAAALPLMAGDRGLSRIRRVMSNRMAAMRGF